MSRSALIPYVAPALLTVVALGQILAASQGHLSPWKGGGFGMFSTVESPGSRFVRAYLVTERERIPVLLPNQMGDLERDVRTMPSPARLRELARRLARGSWVRYRPVPPGEQYRTLRQRYYLARGQRERADEAAVRVDVYSLENEAYAGLLFERMRFLQMVDDPGAARNAVAFQRVDVEVWQLRFDRNAERLVAHRILAGSVARNG